MNQMLSAKLDSTLPFVFPPGQLYPHLLFNFRRGETGVFQLDAPPVVRGPESPGVVEVRPLLRPDALFHAATAVTGRTASTFRHLELDYRERRGLNSEMRKKQMSSSLAVVVGFCVSLPSSLCSFPPSVSVYVSHSCPMSVSFLTVSHITFFARVLSVSPSQSLFE